MLSYRHEYHAGHHADVLKHAALGFLMRYLGKKEAGFLVLDTHAGAGLYDLHSAAAEKTGEYRSGIALLIDRGDAPDLIRGYLDDVRGFNPGGGLAVYPGSPALAAAHLRPQDRLVLYELHPTDYAALADWARRLKRKSHVSPPKIFVRRDDGLAALKGLAPPPEKRALVLIDPSYEIKTDYDAVVAALAAAWRRFPGGVYALWYPVIDRARVDRMTEAIGTAGLRKVLRIELRVAPDAAGRGMTGSGLFVVNPPYTLEPAAREALPWLAAALGGRGGGTVEWVAGE